MRRAAWTGVWVRLCRFHLKEKVKRGGRVFIWRVRTWVWCGAVNVVGALGRGEQRARQSRQRSVSWRLMRTRVEEGGRHRTLDQRGTRRRPCVETAGASRGAGPSALIRSICTVRGAASPPNPTSEQRRSHSAGTPAPRCVRAMTTAGALGSSGRLQCTSHDAHW
jgi:hypothetical protein